MLPKPLNQALPLPGRGLPLFQLENGERSTKTALPSYQQLQRQPFPLPARHDGGAQRGTAGHGGAQRGTAGHTAFPDDDFLDFLSCAGVSPWALLLGSPLDLPSSSPHSSQSM